MNRSHLRLDSIGTTILILALLTLVVAAPLFTCSWFDSHEETYPLQRMIALAEEIRHGDFYPRWLSLTYFGKGSPFFDFYSPLSYLLPSYLFAVGIPLTLAAKSFIVACFFLGSWGMFLWTRPHYGATGATAAAILYMFAPYHFVDLYVRGAHAEFAALAVLPYLFRGFDVILEESRPLAGTLLTAASSAILLLTHHLSTLMIIPLALIYCLWRISRLQQPLKTVGTLGLSALLGAALSSFYWLPMLMEKRYLHDLAATVTTGYGSVDVHFVTPGQWFSTYWGFGPSNGPGVPDEMSFQLGVVLLISLVISFCTLWLQKDALNRRQTLLLLTCGWISLFLTIEASSFFYRLIPTFAFVQFPWRFLGPATLFFAAAGGAIAAFSLVKRYPAIFLILLVGLSLVFSRQQIALEEPINGNIEAGAIELIRSQEIGSLCSANEYLPKWAPQDTMEIRAGLPYIPAGKILEQSTAGKSLSLRVSVDGKESPVIIPQYYFPGWKATLDGNPTEITPSPEGFVMLTVPSGEHGLHIYFGTTTPRIIGWFFTMVGLATFSGLMVRLRRERLSRSLAHQEVTPA